MSAFDWLSGLGGNAAGLILPFLFVLTIVVFFHELGHFLIARWCGVKIKVFSIGFGPEIVGFNDRSGTRWRLSVVPLGGYVRFLGDENEVSRTDPNAAATMAPDEWSRTFAGQNVAKRAAIVAAGPIANFILAIVIFAGIFAVYGREEMTARVDTVKEGSAAAAAGFQPGDVVQSINGAKIEDFTDMQRIVSIHAGDLLTIVVDRGGGAVTLQATPQWEMETDGFGNQQRMAELGIERVTPARVDAVVPASAAAAAGFQPGDVVKSINGKAVDDFGDLQQTVSSSPGQALSVVVDRAGTPVTLVATPTSVTVTDRTGKTQTTGQLGIPVPDDSTTVHYSLPQAVSEATQETWFVVDRTLGYLVNVVVGKEPPDQLGGPIRVAEVSAQVATLGIVPLINLAAILSISIGLINLFPIPMLDGGHLLFFGFEAVRGRPLSERAQEIGFRIGFAAVLALMIFTTGNDISSLWHRITGTG